MAIQLYPDGMSFRRVAQHLGVNPQSVANWVKTHTETLPAAPVPEKVAQQVIRIIYLHQG